MVFSSTEKFLVNGVFSSRPNVPFRYGLVGSFSLASDELVRGKHRKENEYYKSVRD
tara:strand:+ start:224870 stop:225037 length:168 start_codon:yes stop_codon:yes gene_type:complete